MLAHNGVKKILKQLILVWFFSKKRINNTIKCTLWTVNDVTGKKSWKEDKGPLQFLKDLSRWKTPWNSCIEPLGLSKSPFPVTSLTVHSAWTIWSKIKFQSNLSYCIYNRVFKVGNCNFHMPYLFKKYLYSLHEKSFAPLKIISPHCA